MSTEIDLSDIESYLMKCDVNTFRILCEATGYPNSKCISYIYKQCENTTIVSWLSQGENQKRNYEILMGIVFQVAKLRGINLSNFLPYNTKR